LLLKRLFDGDIILIIHYILLNGCVWFLFSQSQGFETGKLVVGRKDQHQNRRLWYGVLAAQRQHARDQLWFSTLRVS
jgi:hypothetical protein